MEGVPHDQDEDSRVRVSPVDTSDSQQATSPRRPYHRESSWMSTSQTNRGYQAVPPEHDIAEPGTHDVGDIRGLGLSNIPGQGDRLRRVPIGSKDNLRQEVSGSDLGATSSTTNSRGVFSEATTANNTPANRHDGGLHVKWPSPDSSQQSFADPGFQHVNSKGALLDHTHGEHHCDGCPTHGDVLKTRMDWFTTTILVLAIYSTIFSAVFLGIALAKPRWGHRIGTQGRLSYSSATLLSALFSKTVELSFTTVFVATLGQMLSRRAFVRDAFSRIRGGGISIAEMNLRLWIMQPGTLITNWIGVRYALPTVLGIVTFIATLSTIFYTTAAEGLVAPKLRMGKYQQQEMFGKVSAAYANSIYLSNNCQTPIPSNMEALAADRGGTCLQIEHAGQGFHNFDSWITQWAQAIKDARIGPQDTRTVPLAILHDNTTINGQWITPSGENITTDSQKWGRLLQNVTMVMPHSNLFNAVRDPRNGILQPEDLQGEGEYVVKAAIPAPAINVLCAGLSTTELAPMIINNSTKTVPIFPFTTVLDEIFGWQTEGGNSFDHPPWFAKAPKEYNTVANFSSTWGPSGIYLLAKPPNATVTNDYVLCSMRSMQYPNCTTSYHVADSGGNLTVHCDSDPSNVLPYSRFARTAPYGKIEPNWKDVAIDWVRAVALTHGVNDGDAAIARMLTQMIPAYDNQTFSRLRAGLPSYGEALGVLAGCTLLLSAGDAPFQHDWTFSDEYFFLEQPQYERFHALVAYKDFASGGIQKYQGIFYIILVSTFVLNFFCAAYLIWNFWHYGHVTDYTEPQNLFALAINSPPSNLLAGACGSGPSGPMLGKKWYVDMSRQETTTPITYDHSPGMATATGKMHPHFYVRPTDDDESPNLSTPQPYTSPYANSSSWPNTPGNTSEHSRFLPFKSPRFGSDMFKGALSRSKSMIQNTSDKARARARGDVPRVRSMHDLTVDESPAVEQYLRLVGRR